MISCIYATRPSDGNLLLTMLHWISIIITFPVNLWGKIPWIGPILQPWIVVFWWISRTKSFFLPGDLNVQRLVMTENTIIQATWHGFRLGGSARILRCNFTGVSPTAVSFASLQASVCFVKPPSPCFVGLVDWLDPYHIICLFH
ncbi:hypothetical protein CEXT_632071 [Caerostris extrusa]|uniref:Uncharacterized protein n=1 Tax=Caerostris extrusa TaxID=172846 RepID=A0AAV4X0H8_CAEEX|nr:hypothetical protein CEXT_632071 [Caerostris extrusa]